MRPNKKATVVLLASSIAFLIAVVIFYAATPNMQPGQRTKYLGETELKVYDTYQNGEAIMIYIDEAARQSARKAAQENGTFEQNFKKNFQQHITQMRKIYNVSLSSDNYAITKTGSEVKGITTQKITLKENGIEYSFMPNFKVVF
ncbi:hypothetical protein HY643_02860 [Candidatus Woesearchaeota archaeon]|nr:hypothetical protein [Candidatus Woesearchaeota archaeon]